MVDQAAWKEMQVRYKTLEENERRYRELFDMVPAGVYTCGTDGRPLTWNRAAVELWGREPEEKPGAWTGGSKQYTRNGEPIAPASSPIARAVSTGTPVREECVIERPDGSRRLVLVHPEPIKDESGTVIGGRNVLIDITQRREMEEALLESRERFQAIADHIEQMVWMAGSDGGIHWYNKRWNDYTGATAQELAEHGWERFHHPDHAERATLKFKEQVAYGEGWEDSFPIRDRNGDYKWFRSNTFPVRDGGGTIQRWFGTNSDISDSKSAEEELADLAGKKDRFLATLAHELRGPLAPLKNGLQLLDMAPLDDALQERTRVMMARQLDHLVHLLDDLMDLSRFNRGKISMNKEQVDLREVIRAAVEANEPAINNADHALRIEGTEGPVYVNGDPDRLIQATSNLLANAAKFTGRGGSIALGLHQEGAEAVIRVKDNGIGIEPSAMPKVYEMFSQLDAHGKKHGGEGLGIGLHIVDRIMRMHHGSVEGYSEGSGKGSEFTLRIPLMAASAPRSAPMMDTTVLKEVKRRVLVVDDNLDAAFSMSMMLKKQGHEVATAHDGEQALTLGAEFRPDIVIMDIGMPKMNGYEACAAMRKTEWGTRIRIVALSGWGQEEDRRRSLEAGYDMHVVKPIDRATVLRIVAG